MAIAMSLLMSLMLSPKTLGTDVVAFVNDVFLTVVTSWGLGFTVGGVGDVLPFSWFVVAFFHSE